MGGLLSKGLCDHASILIGHELWTWGGYHPNLPLGHDAPKKKQLFTSAVSVFKILESGTVQRRLTTGTPPNGAINYSACCHDTDIYYFGGSCLVNDCYHNQLFRFNTTNKEWTEVRFTEGSSSMPREKAGCGMISFTEDSCLHLLVIGGHDMLFDNISSTSNNDKITNEIHIACFPRSSHNRATWTEPLRTGCSFAPLSGFSIDTLPACNKAILFGGLMKKNNRSIACTNTVYEMSYTKDNVDFIEIVPPNGSKPQARFNHSSAIISSVCEGVKKYYLLVLGGEDIDHRVMNDCWILDIEQKTWTKLPQQIDEVVTRRSGHCINQLKISENRVWLIITGGKSSRDKMIASPYNISIMELVYDGNHWDTGDVMLTERAQEQLAYKEYLLQSLSEARKEQERTSIERDERDKKHLLQLSEKDSLIAQKELEIRELKEKMLQKDQELAACNSKIVRKEGIIDQHERKIQEHEHHIQVQANKIEHKQGEIDCLNDKVQEQEKLIDSLSRKFSRKFHKDDVELTNDKIGNGAYGEVRIGIFWGRKVAVKRIHAIIEGRHNMRLFQQEMETCESLFHPNIVQYIGSVNSDQSPSMLLFELMSTTLSDQINEKKPRLSRPQIITIASDICSALRYLHEWRPEPIIHKDIGTTNILMNPLLNNWKAKLSDFGSVSIESEPPGNIFYSAPEVRVAGGNHSPAMDIYSFGVVLTDMALHRHEVGSIKHYSAAHTIDWEDMREIVLNCVKHDRSQRISSKRLLDLLKELEKKL